MTYWEASRLDRWVWWYRILRVSDGEWLDLSPDVRNYEPPGALRGVRMEWMCTDGWSHKRLRR